MATVLEELRAHSEDVFVSVLWLMAMMSGVYFYFYVDRTDPTDPPDLKGPTGLKGLKEPLVRFTEP